MSVTESNDWLLWCRLCAKEDLQGNINVFLKSEQRLSEATDAASDMALATAIGKYFWVNMTRGEELPETICRDCLSLVTSLVKFSDRITRVQKLYCILQSRPKEAVNILELRRRFGLQEEADLGVQTVTEVHYVEEKPKLNDLEEVTLELENPLTPSGQKVDSKINEAEVPATAETVEDEDEHEEEEEEEDHGIEGEGEIEQDAASIAEEQPDEQQKEEDAAKEELLSNLCAESDSLNSLDTNPCPFQPKELKARRGKSFPCNECPRIYALPQTLLRHMRQDHSKAGADAAVEAGAEAEAADEPANKLCCAQCEKSFRSRYQLQKHQQQHLPMPKRKRFPCPICSKQFTTNASAQSHAQYAHQEEQRPRPVICEQCGIAVHSLHALKEHLLSHTDYAPFECDVCKKCFKSMSRLKHHKETHDPHKYICPECGMQLNSRPTLNRHRLVHTDQMQHKCDYCGREFKRAKALKNHLILHTGLKPYSCDFCERTFANGSNYRTHKKKSHPEELAAQEAAGGGKTYNRNIPKLEALKAFTKNKDNLSPVATKQSGSFAFGKKPKKSAAGGGEAANPVAAEAASSASTSVIPAIENIYSHIMKPEQQQLILASDGSASILPVEQPESSQIFSY